MGTGTMKKIMVVDNHPSTVETIKEVLSNEGYKVLTAYGGKECLDKIKKKPVDLILLDIMMPHIDGIEVCSKLANDSSLKSIPIITISALSLSESPHEKWEEKIVYYKNVKDHISKPFDNKDLIKKVGNVLEKRSA